MGVRRRATLKENTVGNELHINKESDWGLYMNLKGVV